jgi:hypothetical protein
MLLALPQGVTVALTETCRSWPKTSDRGDTLKGVAPMDYALHAPHVPHLPPRAIAPLVAFVIGGGAAVGIVAISGGLSSSSASQSPTVILNTSHASQVAGSLDQTPGARP